MILGTAAVWDTAHREAAVAIVAAQFGERGQQNFPDMESGAYFAADGAGGHPSTSTRSAARRRCCTDARPLTPLAHAKRTVATLPGVTLRILDDLGHFSFIPEVVGAVQELLARRRSEFQGSDR